MSTWDERLEGDKQNTNDKGTYQVRTRQFGNAATNKSNGYIRKNAEVPNNEGKYQYQNYQKNDQPQGYEKYDQIDNGSRMDKYVKYEKVGTLEASSKWNKPEKIYQYDRYAKNEKYQSKDYPKYNFSKQASEYSVSDSNKLNEVSVSSQFKRENARTKGLQMRMNNIQSISDKINNLLSMVKKDNIVERISQYPKERIIDRSANNKRGLSPKIHTKNSEYSPKQFESKTPSRKQQLNREITHEGRRQKSSNKQVTNRLRTLSQLSPAHYQNNPIPKSPNKRNQYLNEEDTNQNFSNKNSFYEKSKKQERNKQQINQRRQFNYQAFGTFSPDMNDSHKNNTSSENYKNINKEIDRIFKERRNIGIGSKESQFTPNKSYLAGQHEKSASRNHHSPVDNYNAKYNLSSEDTFMPITLQKEDYNYNYPKNTGGMKLDNQIARVRAKIKQSDNNNQQLEQRLHQRKKDQQNRLSHPGRLYNRAQVQNPPNKFQIKIFPVVNEKEQTVRIAEKLSEQIQLDNRMRPARQAFDANRDQAKWYLLEQNLKNKGIKMTTHQIKEIIRLSPDQYSPFPNQSEIQSASLVELYCEAQKFWSKEVYGCATLRSLKSEGFDINQIDLNKKGYLSIEDLVCFVNLYTGHSYRNRDLTLIFRRLQLLQGKQKVGIQFSTFLRAMSI